MSKIDYEATSTLWLIPKEGLRAQPMELHQIPLSDAIKAMLALGDDEQQRASIEVKGRAERIPIAEAKAIYKRPDFPND